MGGPSQKFKFGPWLPDQPELDNSGLVEAKNVIWTGGSYRPYVPFVPSGAALTGAHVLAAYQSSLFASLAIPGYLFAGSTDASAHTYLSYSVSGFTFSDVTPTAGIALAADRMCFTQYGLRVFATYGNEAGLAQPSLMSDLSFPAPFAHLTGPFGFAPNAFYCSVIGQFLVLANLQTSTLSTSSLQWSGIDAPLNWPTPNSADAIAQQSGAQTLDFRLGEIHGVTNGDQWGVVLLDGGVERMTYIGGDAVFQFDNIYRGPAIVGPNAWIKVGGRVFFLSPVGALVTDGTSVIPIGDARVDRWLIANADFAFPLNFNVGVDYVDKVIYWTFPTVGNSGIPNAWLAYHYTEDKWTHGTDAVQCYARGEESNSRISRLQAFNTAARGGAFSGTPGTATLITGEVELNPGGTALVSGVRPQITGVTAANIAITVSSRNNQTDALADTAGTAIDAFTGQSDMLVDARYHRAKFEIQGAFSQAIGGEFEAEPSSQT